MRIIFKAISSALITITFLFVAEFALGVSAYGAGKNQFRYLILGLDDAASNSDSIMILTYNSGDNTSSLIQIPRDTYCKTDSGINKLNSVFAYQKASGISDKAALEKTKEFISEKLGVRFDGCLALRLIDLVKLVDAFGGVVINLPGDVNFYDNRGNLIRSFKAGENLLTGKDAAFFVRYRAGYANGDLGRLDAQKVFLNALITTAIHNTGVDELLDIAKVFSDNAITNIKVREILGMVLKHSSKFSDTAVTYLTMPGMPVPDKIGAWYYVLNRKSAVLVLQKHLHSDGNSFDNDRAFLNQNDKGFSDIYFSENINWKEYHSFER